jgi:DNA-binding response OmpR family regulator
MADLNVTVVVLSTSKDRVEAIRAASKRKGLACIVAADEQGAVGSFREDGGIFVVDAQSASDLNSILRNRSPGWPILVLASRFDSSAWVEMFKAGATEVIGDPLHAKKVDTALEGFMIPPSTRSPVHTIWRSLARRFGFGSGPQMR